MTDSTIAKLLADHENMRTIAARFDALLKQEQCADHDALAALRWEMTTVILRHLPIEDRAVFYPLESHPDPDARALAAAFKASLETIYGRFQAHAEKWTRDNVCENWDAYRQATRLLVDELVARATREETELYPLLAGLPAAEPKRRPTDRNWAADAPRFRALINSADAPPPQR